MIKKPHKMRVSRSLSIVVLVLFTILAAATILWFSSRTAEESNQQSIMVTDIVLRVFYPGYSQMSEAEKQVEIDHAMLYVRKVAHVMEFAVFSLLCTLLLGYMHRQKPQRLKRYALLAMTAGVCLAAVDEFSQLSVSGRSGSIIDVGIDTIGVVIGAVIGWLNVRRKR